MLTYIAVGLSLLSITIASIAHFRLHQLITAQHKSTALEKLAMIYVYINNIPFWETRGVDPEIEVERMKAEMEIVGKLKIDEKLLNWYIRALGALKVQLINYGYKKEAKRIDNKCEEVFGLALPYFKGYG